jgi:hypothetical protein
VGAVEGSFNASALHFAVRETAELEMTKLHVAGFYHFVLAPTLFAWFAASIEAAR